MARSHIVPFTHNHPEAHQFEGVNYKWTSRNNRKGRHALAVDPTRLDPNSPREIPTSIRSAAKVAQGIWRMFSTYPVWDISFDVATIFTLGSVVWVINAFFVWLPLVQPSTEFNNEITFGGGITALVGATIFGVGSILLVAEAFNENRTGCFG